MMLYSGKIIGRMKIITEPYSRERGKGSAVDCECTVCGKRIPIRIADIIQSRYQGLCCEREPIVDTNLLVKMYTLDRIPIRELSKYFRSSGQRLSRLLKENGISLYKKSIYRQKKGYKDISGTYWGRIKQGASKRNLEFNITIEYAWSLLVQQNFKCAISGLDIIINPNYVQDYKKKRQKQTASLDRINSSIGYVVNNVEWIHKQFQDMKMDRTKSDFIKLCKLVSNYND